MGSDRRKYQDKTASEVSIKLHNEFNINKQEAYEYWSIYQKYKSKHSIFKSLNHVYNLFDPIKTMYFAALAMEMLTKEIIEGIIVDKEKN